MLEFFEQYGPSILAAIVALSGAITSVWSAIKMFKTEKRVKIEQTETKNAIQITQDGVVEAFKRAKIPAELRVSLNEQVDKKLEAWAEKFLIMFAEHEKLRDDLMVANAKILAYTAAFNKLTVEEQEHINELIKEITEKDRNVEV